MSTVKTAHWWWAQIAKCWQALREWSGEAAYEKYVQCTTRKGLATPLSAADFYVEQLNRKYSRPSRCC